MNIDSHYWSKTDQTVHLTNLFEYLHFTVEEKTSRHVRYAKEGKQYIVIFTQEGYYYYDCERPEEKLRASDCIAMFCSGIRTREESSIWERISRKYDEYLASGLDTTPKHILKEVPLYYNHFLHMQAPVHASGLISLYQKTFNDTELAQILCMDEEGYVLFPLYNYENVVCGYLYDTPSGIQPYQYTNPSAGIWYTPIPKKTDQIIVFNTPLEALAFYTQYQPQNTLCIACSVINYSIHTIITRFQKITKAKRLWYSFTGDTVIQGYFKDLEQIAQIHHLNVTLHHSSDHLRVILKKPDASEFAKCYRKIQAFNESVYTNYKKINKTESVHQNLVSKYSIIVKQTEVGDIYFRIPLESNAMKFFICVYQKYFMPNTIGILKPKEVNWYREFSVNQNHTETLDYKKLKIAI